MSNERHVNWRRGSFRLHSFPWRTALFAPLPARRIRCSLCARRRSLHNETLVPRSQSPSKIERAPPTFLSFI